MLFYIIINGLQRVKPCC